MAILEIYRQGHPVLKKKSKAVKTITPTHVKLIRDMIETMRAAPGIGLAAPQVGVSERIIVVALEQDAICIINPAISKKSGKQTGNEACLSVPGFEAPVQRFEKITVKGMNIKGEKVSLDLDGYYAVVFQHEIDHLDGILYVDRVKDPSKITMIKKEDKSI